MDFKEKLQVSIRDNNSLLCVGLDPVLEKLPSVFQTITNPLFESIIDATVDLVCAYKPNSAFYEAAGAEGIEQLKLTCQYLKDYYPTIPIILDFKRADIGSTNAPYAALAFDYLEVDAVTIHPYLGQEAIQPFLDYAEKGIIVLCRTSNSGAGEFQDLEVNGKKLYQYVAQAVSTKWNGNNNCLLVVGATYPDELAEVRQIIGDDMFMLMPGIGAQGGDIEASVTAGKNSKGSGLIINSGRDIIYASNDGDFAEAAGKRARETRDIINQYR
jgi:orotidine-5'-phosphate decarboxylase